MSAGPKDSKKESCPLTLPGRWAEGYLWGGRACSSSEHPRAVTTEPSKEGGLTGAASRTLPHSKASPSRLLHTPADARSTGLLSTFQARFPFRESHLGPFSSFSSLQDANSSGSIKFPGPDASCYFKQLCYFKHPPLAFYFV